MVPIGRLAVGIEKANFLGGCWQDCYVAMRIVIFSTETKHHTYCINKLDLAFEIVGVFYERKVLTKPYATGPFFAKEEDGYEDRFFSPAHGGTEPRLSVELQDRIVSVHDVNQRGVAQHVRALEPDVGITYGVGRVGVEVFAAPAWGTLNIHRGIAQCYRGLDSDLWAIYQNAFDDIGVTIHYVEEGLDTGDILGQRRVSISPDDEIYHLRYKTSIVATDLLIEILKRMDETGGAISGQPHGKPGPYYSAMSLADKQHALANFEIHKCRLQSRGPAHVSAK